MMLRKIVWTALAVLIGSTPIGAVDGAVDAPKGKPKTVINNYYDSRRDFPAYGAPVSPYVNPVQPPISPYVNPVQPPISPYPNYYQPYGTPTPSPYYDRLRYNDNREMIRQRYFNQRVNPAVPPITQQPVKRPSLSDRIQQESEMRKKDSRLQRDYIREESLRSY